MKLQISGLLALATLFMTSAWISPSHASEAEAGNGDNYFSVSMLRGNYDIDNLAETGLTTVNFAFGRMLTDYIGVEGRLGLGINEGTDDDCAYVDTVFVCETTGINLDHFFGAYARGYFLEPGTSFRPYGVLGYSKGEASINADGAMFDRSESGLTYGIGVEMGSRRMRFTAEYLSIFDSDGTSLGGISAGLLIGF